MTKNTYSFFACLLLPFTLMAQDQDRTKISGIVFNQETQKPLGYVQLVSYKTFLSYASDADGTFFLSLPKEDSLKIVSMGFEGVVKKVSDFLKTPGPDTIYLKPASYMLNEVVVNAREQQIDLKLPRNIGKNVDPDKEPEPFTPDPSLGMIFSPLTLAQSAFGKKARNHRRLKRTMEQRNEKSLWFEVLSSGLIKDWIEIKDDELDNFIVFCNSKIKVTNNDNLLTLRGKVIQLWHQYKNKNEE